MSKQAVCRRNEERRECIEKYKSQSLELKKIMNNIRLSEKARSEARQKFHAIPRKARAVRYRNRCKICGRPRAYNRFTGLCRFHMRILVSNGEAPGMLKDSF